MLDSLNEKLDLQGKKEKWNSFDKKKKASIVAIACCILVFVYMVSHFTFRTNYVPLFTDMEPADAGKIVEGLSDQNVPYRLSNEGTSILVPEKDVYELRLSMASEGMVHGAGKGFELFDETRLGATDFDRRLSYQRALQEELRRTISQLGEVEQARVHLVMPEPSVFLEESNQASASILLQTKPLASLEKEQIRSIVNLTAGSVENLKEEDVSVIDSQGNVLNDLLDRKDPDWAGSDLALKHLEVKSIYERELENRIQRSLEKVYGPGKVVAMVSADLDFDSKESTSVTYGTEVFPRTEHSVTEEYSGEGGGMPGGTGADENVPGYPAYGAMGDMEYERTEETREYEIDEMVAREVNAPGKVERISTSVIIDDSDEGMVRLADGGGEVNDEVTEMISTAVGFDMERGDTISVQRMDFNHDYKDELAALMEEPPGFTMALWHYALAGALAVILLVAAVVIIKRRKGEEIDEAIEDESYGVEDLVTEAVKDKPESEMKKKQKEIKEMAEQKPEEVVQLLKTWMAEE